MIGAPDFINLAWEVWVIFKADLLLDFDIKVEEAWSRGEVDLVSEHICIVLIKDRIGSLNSHSSLTFKTWSDLQKKTDRSKSSEFHLIEKQNFGII